MSPIYEGGAAPCGCSQAGPCGNHGPALTDKPQVPGNVLVHWFNGHPFVLADAYIRATAAHPSVDFTEQLAQARLDEATDWLILVQAAACKPRMRARCVSEGKQRVADLESALAATKGSAK